MAPSAGPPPCATSKHCYYHVRYHFPELEALPDNHELRTPFPTLEDANSIQVSLAHVMERLVMQEIDHKTAALLLYALQTASMNLKRTSLEPELPTQVVIDRKSVANRPIGASAWSRIEGREYDDLTDDLTKDDRSKDDRSERGNGKQPADSPVSWAENGYHTSPTVAPAPRRLSQGRPESVSQSTTVARSGMVRAPQAAKRRKNTAQAQSGIERAPKGRKSCDTNSSRPRRGGATRAAQARISRSRGTG
jgi:hypothetical protein